MAAEKEKQKVHMIVVPLTAQGHMIPMADLALLLAARGVRVSLITTPVNARRLRAAADHASSSGLPLSLVELSFPCAEAGLPDGCENLDLIPRPDLFHPFFTALNLLATPLKQYLRAQPPGPTCIISDQCMPWTMSVASELSIPRIVFHGPSCFFLLCILKLAHHGFYHRVSGDDMEPFPVPELPQRIEVTRLTAQRFFNLPGMEDVRRHVQDSEDAADGIVLNTFYELESWYVDEYRRAVKKEVWPVGPVSMFHSHDADGKAVRGDGSGFGVDNGCIALKWLEGREEGSVLFVCFGSIARTRMRQMAEIGFGLEASGRAFIWVLKEAEKGEEVEKWLKEFEGRNEGRGLVIKGWAPQVLILTHPAVGGFVTHCGWNSALEGVAAGMPMLTWPHFSDQFLNEKLLVEVLGTAVGVGVEMPSYFQATNERAVVGREKVERAVTVVMAEGGQGEEMRKRARGFGEKAKKAMEEGGSSYENLSRLIEYVTMLARKSSGNGKDEPDISS